MHTAVKQFIKHVRLGTRSTYGLSSHFRFKKVLEVGSCDINGSPRKYFWFCKYTGVDVFEGPGVDIVGEFNELAIGGFYDVVISTEMLEHDKTWKDSLIKMYECTADGGLLLITCAGPDRPEHWHQPHYTRRFSRHYRLL